MSLFLELRSISKRYYTGVLANDNVNFSVNAGEIHGLVGENGAGKTTLMKVLAGLEKPNNGEIVIRGEKVNIRNSQDSIKLGIGMVHQRFTLVGSLTVAENIVLGTHRKNELFFNQKRACLEIKQLSKKYKLDVPPEVKIEELEIGVQQRVEILKALYRSVNVLILDEPSSVLTPREITYLFEVLKNLKNQGKAIILITHKLREVISITDRVTVMRQGRVTGDSLITKNTNEKELARLMIGREVFGQVNKKKFIPGKTTLELKSAYVYDDDDNPILKDINFQVREKEIVGIAGIQGNGQAELAEILTGLREIDSGQIFVYGQDCTKRSTPHALRKLAVGHIPGDRHLMGTCADASILENMILGVHDQVPYRKGLFLDLKVIENIGKKLINRFKIITSSAKTSIKTLSGGNIQKVVLAREFNQNPNILIASHPTRGIDVGSAEFIHQQLLEIQEKGKSIVLISTELEEILKLSDTIYIIYKGKIIGKTTPAEADEESLGLMMAGIKNFRN